MSHHREDPTNLETLDHFWRRRTFHDMGILEIRALNRRVVICLKEYTLIVTGVTGLKRCDVPALWQYESVTPRSDGFLLDVETDMGPIQVAGKDVRLLRNSDLALLIPPLDAG